MAHSNNMVSVGIQNESGILNGLNNHSSKKKAKTKTIILVDVGLQTGVWLLYLKKAIFESLVICLVSRKIFEQVF